MSEKRIEEFNKECEEIKYFNRRVAKLNELENMIRKLQYYANYRSDNRLTENEIKMEIFKLWYYVENEIEWR